jgi:hypothetical protein
MHFNGQWLVISATIKKKTKKKNTIHIYIYGLSIILSKNYFVDNRISYGQFLFLYKQY